eukprot:384588_1
MQLMLLNITYFNGVFILLIPQIFHLTSSAWCELFVYANQNRGGSSWPSGTGFDVAECINTDGNFQNDIISSAYLESKSGYTCTAIFYEACTCAGRTETLIVNPHSSNTINFGTIDNLVSCIKVIVHTPQPTFTPTTHPPSIVTLSPTLISLQPTFTPSISPSNNPTTAYPTLISYSPTLSPTNSIAMYNITYGIAITVIFDYKTTNISQIEIELSIITQNIINQRILVNNLTNCAVTNNYNISIKNTLKSVNITNAKIRATIFVCDDTSQYKLYATFNETLQTDFIEKLQLIAIQPNGFHIDVDIVCDNIECMSTTKQLIYTTIYDKMDNQNIDMNFVVIIIVVIMTLLFIIVILIGIILKLKPKFMNSMKTLELNTVSNDI